MFLSRVTGKDPENKPPKITANKIARTANRTVDSLVVSKAKLRATTKLIKVL